MNIPVITVVGVARQWGRRLCLVGMGAALALAGLPLGAEGRVVNHPGGRIVPAYIQPAVLDLVNRADAMSGQLLQFCSPQMQTQTALKRFDPSQVGVASSRVADAFTGLVQAWGRVEFLRFGPLVDANRFERLSFWPDPRQVGLRQMPSVLSAYARGKRPDLAAQSVAVQGLPALEQLLYGKEGLLVPHEHSREVSADSPEPSAPGVLVQARCDYAIDIVSHVAALGNALMMAWADTGSYGEAFINPVADNPYYRTHLEVVAESIKAMSTGLQFVEAVKIAPALKAASNGFDHRRMPWWRSKATDESIAATLDGIRLFFVSAEFDLGDAKWAGDQFQSELAHARQLLLSGADDAKTWQAVRLVVINAKRLLDEDIAPALGVGMGFNALDGD